MLICMVLQKVVTQKKHNFNKGTKIVCRFEVLRFAALHSLLAIENSRFEKRKTCPVLNPKSESA